MHRLTTLGFAIALLSSSLGCATAGPAPIPNADPAPVISRIVERGELRVGMSGNQPPLNFKGRNGQVMGLEVDVARALAMMMGVEPRWVHMPFGKLLGALQRGEVDVVISGMTITPARNMKVAFVGPYLLSGKSILTKSSTLAKIEDASELDRETLKLAALEGSTSEDFVNAFIPQATLVPTEDYDTAIRMLQDDEVQAFVADYEICALHAALHRDAGFVTLESPLTVEPLGMAVAPGDGLFLNLVQNTMGALEASGLLDGLRARWLESAGWVEELP